MKELKKIEDKLHQLSPELLKELEDYLDFLITKKDVQ